VGAWLVVALDEDVGEGVRLADSLAVPDSESVPEEDDVSVCEGDIDCV